MVDDDTIERAKRYNRAALEAIFAEYYPVVHRMGCALCGTEAAGRRVVVFVLNRALRAVPRWRDETDVQRWFHHHSVLTSRRATREPPVLSDDVFITGAENRDASYPAFVRAMRSLPRQQGEAFLLHYGERLNVRYLAIAMDCSTAAAQTHLSAAQFSLRAMGGTSFEAFTAQIAHCYMRLTPTDRIVLPNVRRAVARYVWPRRIWNAFRLLFIAAILVAIVVFAWKLWPRLVW